MEQDQRRYRGRRAQIPAREHFVIVGLSRLAVPVVACLRERRPDATLVIVAMDTSPAYEPMVRRHDADIVYATDGVEHALRHRVDLARATCVLALADSDLENMRTAAVSHKEAPHVPMVVRVFDAVLADQLERLETAPKGGLNIRRAYSMADLAAPHFLAGALGERVRHLQTMRFGDRDIPIFGLVLGSGSPAVGQAVGEVERRFGCAVIAHRGADAASTTPAPRAGTLMAAGDHIVIGGPEAGVFSLAAKNGPPEKPAVSGTVGRDREPEKPPAAEAEPAERGRRRARNITLLPRVALGLALLTLASMVVVLLSGRQKAVDAFYWTLTAAASGSPAGPNLKGPSSDPSDWLKLFSTVPIISGGALAGVLFSYLASVATTQRIEQRMGQRARKMRGQVVIAGFGTVGFSLERMLWRLHIPTVVIESSPGDQFVGGGQDHAAVLSGDVRLPGNLERAGIRNASCLIAVTDDDLANVVACLNARSINPSIRTVARIFDDTLSTTATAAFGINECFAAVDVAAPAFVDAATDSRAVRRFEVEDAEYRGLRYKVRRTVGIDEIDRWRRQGVRVIAFLRGDEHKVLPPSALDRPLVEHDVAVVAGPREVMAKLTETGEL